MNSFLKKFQDVVDMGKEQDAPGILSQDPQSTLTSSSDPVVLRRHIATLAQQLARQAQSYEELRVESTGIEKELTRLRLRFAASRELWDTANQQLEVVIQNLLEHQLYGSSTSLPSAANSEAVDTTLDATYVASLREQIQRLKEMVQRSGEERTQLRSERQYEQTQLLMRSSGLADAALGAEIRQALEKMVLHWAEERAQYETTIESLEQHVAQHAEREALLSDEIRQKKESLRSMAAAAEQSDSELQQQLCAVQAELEEWRSGARTLPVYSVRDPLALPADTVPASEVCANTQTAMLAAEKADSPPHPGAAASADRTNAVVSTPLPLKPALKAASAYTEGGAIDARIFQEQQAELEMLRQDYSTREEALDSLYADSKRLQEALQRAEAQARQSDAELQDCQRRLEEAQKQLAREQQKTKRKEEERQKAVAVEAKLREQIRELRQALTAAAAAAEHDVTVSPAPYAAGSSVGGLSIPQTRGVRVGLPYRHEMAQAIAYDDGGTWREWAVEAGRWWSELKGDAVPQRGVSTSSSRKDGGVGGLYGRSALAPRRGPRVLLLFAGVIGIIMTAFLCLIIMETMYAAFRSTDA